MSECRKRASGKREPLGKDSSGKEDLRIQGDSAAKLILASSKIAEF